MTLFNYVGDMSDFNTGVITEFRANGGVVSRFGDNLVLLHTVGAKSGQPRVHPVLALIQPDGSWLIAASAAGSPKHPAWYLNIVANRDITIETGAETVAVAATDVTDPDYDAAWAQFLAAGPSFSGYQERAGDRRIPVVRLTRR
jgi:deazaflavin-dependent oxidoreductase (nitroreductase family)